MPSSNSFVDMYISYFKCESNNAVLTSTTALSTCSASYPSDYAFLPLNEGDHNHCTIECTASNHLSNCGNSFPNECNDIRVFNINKL